MLRAYGLSDKGHLRASNEDCFGIDEGLGLCVLADGMGGHNAGEVASQMAVDIVTDYVRSASGNRAGAYGPFGSRPDLSHDANVLRTAVHLANTQILEAGITTSECSGMGTTIVAAFVRGNRLCLAHVGDSRMYLFRGHRLRQLTADDTWTATVLARDPRADLSALQTHPLRHALTNVVGAHPKTEVHLAEEVLQAGDLLLLTTDGVHGVVEDQAIEELLDEGRDAAGAAAALIAASLARGSRDNCTAIVAQYFTE